MCRGNQDTKLTQNLGVFKVSISAQYITNLSLVNLHLHINES